MGKCIYHNKNDKLPAGVNQTRIPFLYDIIKTDFSGILDYLMNINNMYIYIYIYHDC